MGLFHVTYQRNMIGDFPVEHDYGNVTAADVEQACRIVAEAKYRDVDARELFFNCLRATTVLADDASVSPSLDQGDTFNKLVLCVHRKERNADVNALHFLYIKQDASSGKYAVKWKTQNNKSVLYTTTQWLPVALNYISLLMAEQGIGVRWIPTE